jgi:hypothetical protein
VLVYKGVEARHKVYTALVAMDAALAQTRAAAAEVPVGCLIVRNGRSKDVGNHGTRIETSRPQPIKTLN